MSVYDNIPWLSDYSKAYEEMKEKQYYLMNKYSKNKTSNKPVTKQPPAETPKTYPTVNNLIKENITEPLSEEQQTLYSQAIELYQKGLDGDSDAVVKSHEIFKKLYLQAPGNIMVEAHYGCLTSLLGRDEFNPNERFKLAMKGLKILDRAVSKESENIEIRNLRGYVCLRLPDMYFHRTSTAVEDFTIKESVRKAGPGKVIYGSEIPLSHPRAELEKIMLLDVTDDAKSKILGSNIRELLSGVSKPTQSSSQVSKPITGSSYGNYTPGYGRVTYR